MTPNQALRYFAQKDASRSPRTVMAEALGVTPQYVHKLMHSQHLPEVVQLRLHIMTDGELKADKRLL